jgi:hypothetical protein
MREVSVFRALKGLSHRDAGRGSKAFECIKTSSHTKYRVYYYEKPLVL